jgi:hypothetical protein
MLGTSRLNDNGNEELTYMNRANASNKANKKTITIVVNNELKIENKSFPFKPINVPTQTNKIQLKDF